MPQSNGVQAAFAQALLVRSEPVPDTAVPVRGPDFGLPLELEALLASYGAIGFQATALSQAIDIVNRMRAWRLSDEPLRDDEADAYRDAAVRAATRCTIMLGYTSNLVSSGLREVIRFLVQHNYVSAIVTTAGGIEEDLIKCLGPTYVAPGGRFDLDGAGLRKKGLNRIGNLLVPNDNYCAFEDWVTPILDALVREQVATRRVWTPSTVIDRLGKEIGDESSILYWAHRNGIPVFCPALTDGSLGDMIFAHSYKTEPQLVVDLVGDIRRLNALAMTAKKAGMVVLGGGVCKHQIANAMLYRNGADFAVYVNTGQEFDGSDTGARPDEAVSWGKIRADAAAVKVCADATLVFPLLVAATWARDHRAPAPSDGPPR